MLRDSRVPCRQATATAAVLCLCLLFAGCHGKLENHRGHHKKRSPTYSEPKDGINARAVDHIIREHNRFRAKVQVPPLKWNVTLAQSAQNYAEQRRGDCALQHSQGPYGENLMYGTGTAWTWKNTVDDWSNEKKNYKYRSNFCKPGTQCGHYTEVVWKHTSDVGCGRVTCVSGDTLMVCNYWPPGNYVGERPY